MSVINVTDFLAWEREVQPSDFYEWSVEAPNLDVHLEELGALRAQGAEQDAIDAWEEDDVELLQLNRLVRVAQAEAFLAWNRGFEARYPSLKQ